MPEDSVISPSVVHQGQMVYESLCASFSWVHERESLGLSDGANIAYHAVDKHANGNLPNTVALRWIAKNKTTKDITFSTLKDQTSRFANVLQQLHIGKGETVFTLLGRVPELYIAALGALKNTSVYCPLFSVFGPDPIFQRLSRGEASVLVTTRPCFLKEDKTTSWAIAAFKTGFINRY
jgi:acetyl-CoA synthetase